MAIELHIFMQDARIPDREAWQQQIEHLKFPTVLDSALNLRRDTGFVPATFKGQVAGFEFYLESAASILSAYPHIRPRVAGRDKCATFRWGGNLAECGSAVSAAAALTKLADGIYFYPDDDILYTAEDVVEATRDDLSSM